ncbi:MAG TPA: SET domain-containing protein-lysine N-methyltransferase [Kofleriaceae bacterium]|jgi:hypothetical protein
MAPIAGIKVVRSNIHGYGGVTARAFAKGETVCFGDGVVYDEGDDFDDTYALVMPGEEAGRDHLMFYDLVCQTRWFNHSCEPNSEVLTRWDAAAQTIVAWWVAVRDIAPGEEVTYDYAFVAEVAEPCHCGAAGCRGLIVDEDPENLAKLPEHLRVLLRRPIIAA